MLNHLWLSLIVVGILVAAGRDAYDGATNSYGNGIPWALRDVDGRTLHRGTSRVSMALEPAALRAHYPHAAHAGDTVRLAATVVMGTDSTGRISIPLDENAPDVLRTVAEAQGGKNALGGAVTVSGGRASAVFDPVRLIVLRRVTNAVFDMAGTAVEIAIGLIGVMALWLGVMKVAEEAGLVRALARAAAPVMKRLFPDVPHDHPAITAILMNVAANMLGLGNAATPFGLKAMEELNSLNPRAGTATNAMCTFLALNTSCVTLIPATALAVRAAMGSVDPAAIVGTSFLASLTATVCAVAIAKLLQRLRPFRIAPAGAEG
jgi:spore maturation protein A